MQIPSLKHALHCVVMISWVAIFIFLGVKEGAKVEDANYGVVLTIILVFIRLVSLLALPQTLLNFVALLIFDTYKEKVKLKLSPQAAPFFTLRVVTRGLYPKLVAKTVARNMDTLDSIGCENFVIEVVTDAPLNLEIYEKHSQRMREIVVPPEYQTSSKALNKSRALHYCWEDTINLIQDDEWVVHLDEETLLSRDSVKGILNFIHEGAHDVGQGLITYAQEQPFFSSWSAFLQNRICTVADSFRVTEDLGKIRGQFKLWHKPIFGIKGSFVVTKAKVERKVGFDNGPEGSKAEDAFFAIKAMDEGHSFDWIEGAMWEKSPFSFSDFIKQRQRWMQGIFLVSTCSRLSLKSRFFIGMALFGWLTVPLSTSNLFLAKVFPIRLWPIVDVAVTFMAAMAFYNYGFGYVKQHPLVRYSIPRLFLVIPEIIFASFVSIICENVAVITMWCGNWYDFYIVQKETEEEPLLFSDSKLESPMDSIV